MSSIKTFSFTDSANYTFDSNKVEVTAGVGRLRDLREIFGDGNAITAATFTTNQNLNWGSAADLTGSLVGGAVVSGGVLDLTPGTGSVYCIWNHASIGAMIAEATTTGAVRIRVKPKYSGSPAQKQTFIMFGNSGGQNKVTIDHTAAGNVEVEFKDSSNTLITTKNFGAWSPTADQIYEFEFNWDLTPSSEAHRLFIDGTQFGSTRTDSGTRDSTQNQIYCGLGGTDEDSHILEFSIFSTVQHTANYTIGETVPETVYATDDPSLVTDDATFLSNISDLTDSITEPGSDEIRYILQGDGADLYWNGSAWVTSDGTYAQSNTSTDFKANIDSAYTLGGPRVSVKFKILLHSDDGSTRPLIDSLQITYSPDLPNPTLPTVVDLEGFLYGPEGAVSGAEVKMRPYQAWSNTGGVHVQYKWIKVFTTSSNGHWTAQALLQPSGKFWEIKFGTGQSYYVALPDVTTTVDFSTLTVTPVED